MFQFPGFALNPYGFRVQSLHLTLRSATPSSLMPSQYKGSKVGFPIRRSLDQSSFAAPQGLSQRTTSFIASQRQGIHQMLLRHLITLMIHVRRSQRRTSRRSQSSALQDHRKDRPWLSPKTVCLPSNPGHNGCGPSLTRKDIPCTNQACYLFTISNTRKRSWLNVSVSQ